MKRYLSNRNELILSNFYENFNSFEIEKIKAEIYLIVDVVFQNYALIPSSIIDNSRRQLNFGNVLYICEQIERFVGTEESIEVAEKFVSVWKKHIASKQQINLS